MEHIGSIIAILMGLIVLIDRFSSRVTPVELERAKAEIFEKVANNYPTKTAFDDVKEKIDMIYDIIIKKAKICE